MVDSRDANNVGKRDMDTEPDFQPPIYANANSYMKLGFAKRNDFVAPLRPGTQGASEA